MTTTPTTEHLYSQLADKYLQAKAERDALLAAVQAYFNAGSERSEYRARERMRDAVERATGERP